MSVLREGGRLAWGCCGGVGGLVGRSGEQALLIGRPGGRVLVWRSGFAGREVRVCW